MRYLLLLLFSTACSLSKKDCETADWYERGFRDGRVGEFTSALTKYKQQCAAHKVEIEIQHYKMGYNDGLAVFCTFDNGYKEGLVGRVDLDVCPPKSRGEYYRGYWAGKGKFHNYQMQKKMDEKAQYAADRARLHALNECHTSLDCPKKDTCVINRCSLSGIACVSNIDCPLQPACTPQPRTYGTVTETINVCQ